MKPVEFPLSAAFKFYDQVGGKGSPVNQPGTRLIQTDTFYLSKAGDYEPIRVIYQAIDTIADSYVWKIGNDPRSFSGRTSALTFDQPGLYPVKLKVTRKNQDGKIQTDSISRSFRIIKTEFHPLIGKYIGFNVSKPDSLFKFFIGHGDQGTWPWVIDTLRQQSGYAGIVMTGLSGPKYCSHYLAVSTKGAFTDEAIVEWPAFAGNYNLYKLFITPNISYDSIYIDYEKFLNPQVGEPSGLKVAEKFIGKRYL